jgi:hypothetical protein
VDIFAGATTLKAITTFKKLKDAIRISNGMLGCITTNLRGISVNYSQDHIFLYFYYHEPPTEDEEKLAEEIATAVVSGFPDVAIKSFKVNKRTIPFPNRIPNNGYPVYHRYEPLPENQD